MNIYSFSNDDELIVELRNWIKNNPFELPEDAKISFGGAVKGEKMSESTKQILREINLGKKHSEDTKLKMSQIKKGKTTWNKGIPVT